MAVFNSTDPYRPIFSSLADRKSVSLAEKYEEKKANLEPAPLPEPTGPDLSVFDTGDSSGGTNLIDVGQASLLRAGGSLADFGRDASNYMFGTEYDSSRESGWSDPKLADMAAGVSPEYRDEIQRGQQQVMTDVVDENYWEAAKSALKVAIPTAIDSTASLAELGVGAAATWLSGGVAAPVLAKKAKGLFDTAENIKKSYDEAKSLKKIKDKADKLAYKEAGIMGKALKNMKHSPEYLAKASSQASILTADLAHQQVQDYREKYGEDPSAARFATMYLTSLATNIAEVGVITKLFIPSFKKQLVDEGKNIAKTLMGSSSLINIAKRVGKTAGAIGAAGGGEAVQEYVQTWQEILSVGISPEESDNLMQAITSQLGSKENQDTAITGGLLGGAAGSAVKTGISAPGVAVGTAVDTAVGTSKTLVKGVDKVRAKASLKILNQDQRDEVKVVYENDKAVAKEKVANWEDNISTVSKANTFEDIKNVEGETRSEIIKAQEELEFNDHDLKNESNFKELKDKVISSIKAKQAKTTFDVENTRLASIVKMIGTNVKDATVSAAQKAIDIAKYAVPDEVLKATIKAAYSTKAAAQAAYKATTELKSSTARGIIDMGIKASAEQLPILIEKAKDLDIDDLAIVMNVIGESGKNPKLSKALSARYESLKSTFKDMKLTRDDLVNENNMHPVLKDIISTGNIDDKSAVTVSEAILQTTSSKIENKATLALVKKAVEIYKTSKAYSDETAAGHLNKTNMAATEAKLKRAEKRLNREITPENTASTIDKGKALSAKAGTKIWNQVVKYGRKGRDLVTRKQQDKRLAEAKASNIEGELDRVQKEIDEENYTLGIERQEADNAKVKAAEEKAAAKVGEKTTGEKIVEKGQGIINEGVEKYKALDKKVRKKIDDFSADIKNYTVKVTDKGVTIHLGTNPWVVEGTKFNLNAEELKQYMQVLPLAVSPEEKEKVLSSIYRKAVSRTLTKGVKDAAKATVKGAKAATQATVETVTDVISESVKTLTTKPLDTIAQQVLDGLQSVIPDALDDQIENIPKIVGMLKAPINNYKTELDFVNLIEAYPNLIANKEFYAAFKEEFLGTTIVMNKDVQIDSEIAVENKDKSVVNKPEAKNNMFPGCK